MDVLLVFMQQTGLSTILQGFQSASGHTAGAEPSQLVYIVLSLSFLSLLTGRLTYALAMFLVSGFALMAMWFTATADAAVVTEAVLRASLTVAAIALGYALLKLESANKPLN